jgi:copper homeostasis protein
MIQVEIACNSWNSCINALEAKANRIELFENLHDGGCTPSAGLIHKAAKLPIPVYVMIRARAGDFIYSNDEIEIMLHDIEICKSAGVKGIVLGCLNKHGELDKATCRRLLEAWEYRPATFHRAIDRSNDLLKAAKDIVDLGFERILSSGGMVNVLDGLENLKTMQTLYGKHIAIMPGAGVNADNARSIIEFTGCKEIHATCKETLSVQGWQQQRFRNQKQQRTNQAIA